MGTQMQHPAPVGTDVKLNVTDTCMIDMRVTSVVFNTVDSSYHYSLEGVMTDGNNAATVQVGDCLGQLLILPMI